MGVWDAVMEGTLLKDLYKKLDKKYRVRVLAGRGKASNVARRFFTLSVAALYRFKRELNGQICSFFNDPTSNLASTLLFLSPLATAFTKSRRRFLSFRTFTTASP